MSKHVHVYEEKNFKLLENMAEGHTVKSIFFKVVSAKRIFNAKFYTCMYTGSEQ